MAIRNVRVLGDEILTKKSKEVKKESNDICVPTLISDKRLPATEGPIPLLISYKNCFPV